MADEDDLRLSELELHDRPSKLRGAFVDQGAIDDSRRTELAGVQQMNTVLEGVISSLDKARNNMEVSYHILPHLQPPTNPPHHRPSPPPSATPTSSSTSGFASSHKPSTPNAS